MNTQQTLSMRQGTAPFEAHLMRLACLMSAESVASILRHTKSGKVWRETLNPSVVCAEAASEILQALIASLPMPDSRFAERFFKAVALLEAGALAIPDVDPNGCRWMFESVGVEMGYTYEFLDFARCQAEMEGSADDSNHPLE